MYGKKLIKITVDHNPSIFMRGTEIKKNSRLHIPPYRLFIIYFTSLFKSGCLPFIVA